MRYLQWCHSLLMQIAAVLCEIYPIFSKLHVPAVVVTLTLEIFLSFYFVNKSKPTLLYQKNKPTLICFDFFGF